MKGVRWLAAACFVLILHSAPPAFSEPSPVTAILGAMQVEIALFKERMTDRKVETIEGLEFTTGQLDGRPVVLARTGVGKVNAAMMATLLLEHFKPTEVLFTGVAGGIHPDLKPGDIVIATQTAQHDLGTVHPGGFSPFGVTNPRDGTRNPAFFPADTHLLQLAQQSVDRLNLDTVQTREGGRKPRIVQGVIVTGDVFVASPGKKEDLREGLNADAVEMEGAAVAQICWQWGVACLVIRSISDSADGNAPSDFKKFSKVAARKSAGLVAEIVKSLGTGRSQAE